MADLVEYIKKIIGKDVSDDCSVFGLSEVPSEKKIREWLGQAVKAGKLPERISKPGRKAKN
jgi:hypothetical protein